MNTQIERPRAHEVQHAAPHYNGDHDEDDGEKKSVLKKVKDKAKKIKDTIKGHVGHHGHDHADQDDDHHQDRQPRHQPQLPHGAPSGGTNSGTVDVLSTGVLEAGIMLEKDPHAPKDVGQGTDPENFQTKVVAPTGMGSKEVEVTPILQQLDKMIIQDQTDTRNTNQTASSYGDAISNVTAKISENAAKAKDIVATKLGYAGSTEEQEANESSGTGYFGEYSRNLAEKLKPGEDAKALFEVINEALPLRRGNEDVASKEDKDVKLGRVTESEEVQNQLGPFEEVTEEKMASAGGRTVVRWMRETIASWLRSSLESLNDATRGNENGRSNSDSTKKLK